MSETIAFPDIEAVIVGWLAAVLPAYGVNQPVSTRVPNPRPVQFIRIVRTGGPRQNMVVDGAQVTIECWHRDSAPTAAGTAAIVRAVVSSAKNVTTPSGTVIYDVDEFSGPALLPDVSQEPRYTWTCRINVRGNAI